MKRWTRRETPILAGFSLRKSYFLEEVVCHQEHEINVAISGTGVYRFGGQEDVELSAGEILLIPAGMDHGIEVEKHLHMAVIHFHPEVYEGMKVEAGCDLTLLKQLKSWDKPVGVSKAVNSDAHGVLVRLTEDAVVEQNRGGIASGAMLSVMAKQSAIYFLRLISQQDGNVADNEMTQRIVMVRQWIDRHFAERCSVSSLSKMANLAPTYFAARFKEVVGVAPMSYVRDRRLNQAAMLLRRTHQPVKVVAWSVGFTDISHFNHAFKQAKGVSPLEYREKIKP